MLFKEIVNTTTNYNRKSRKKGYVRITNLLLPFINRLRRNAKLSCEFTLCDVVSTSVFYYFFRYYNLIMYLCTLFLQPIPKYCVWGASLQQKMHPFGCKNISLPSYKNGRQTRHPKNIKLFHHRHLLCLFDSFSYVFIIS